MLITGFLTQKHIEKLRKLIFSEEEKFLVNKIAHLSKRLSHTSIITTIVKSLEIGMTFLLYVFLDKVRLFSLSSLYLLIFSYVLVSVFAYLIRTVVFGYYCNAYSRLIGAVLDNLISFLLDDYRVSLAAVSVNFPSPKDIANKISDASNSLPFIVASLSSISGLLLGLPVVFIVFLFTGEPFLINVILMSLILLFAFAVYVRLGSLYYPSQKALMSLVDKFDVDFSGTRPLLIRTNLNLYPKELNKVLEDTLRITSKINLISNAVGYVGPVLLVLSFFIPSLSQDFSHYLIVALFIASHSFGHSGIVSHYYSVNLSRERLMEFEAMLDTVLETGAELTPLRYDDISKRYLEENPLNSPISKDCIYESLGLEIKSLVYISGRGDSMRNVYLDYLFLEKNKIHFLIGDSGIGKSIFGRLITLRYEAFKCGFLGMGGCDLRTFSNLDDGLKELHFSSIRNIDTSYRNAIGAYLGSDFECKFFLTQLLEVLTSKTDVISFFESSADYYGSRTAEILQAIENYDFGFCKGDFLGLSKQELRELRECFRSRIEWFPSSKIFILSAIFEYMTFMHLKSFIPEASLYFMDAVLSEPPVSQGQRRRILLTLDVLLGGAVMVIDEPFSNIDLGASKSILRKLKNYNKVNNSVLLVLDQKIHPELLEACRKDGNLGRVLGFSNEGKGIRLVELEDIKDL